MKTPELFLHNGRITPHGPPPLPVSPDWSPVGVYDGCHKGMPAAGHLHQSCSCHGKQQIWLPNEGRLWGLGCDCFAF